jgi:hypothetical protein
MIISAKVSTTHKKFEIMHYTFLSMLNSYRQKNIQTDVSYSFHSYFLEVCADDYIMIILCFEITGRNHIEMRTSNSVTSNEH